MHLGREQGTAVVVALMMSGLLLALAAAVVMTASVETGIASSFRASLEALYGASVAVEFSIRDLQSVADWNQVLNGTAHSAYVDGPAIGLRRLSDGSTIDLQQIRHLATCNKRVACTDADMDAVSGERPWGPNNPRWQLFAFGPLSLWLDQSAGACPIYAVVLVADDPSENDADPLRDGWAPQGGQNPGRGIVLLRVQAFGPRGAHHTLEATLARPVGAETISAVSWPAPRVLSWRHLR